MMTTMTARASEGDSCHSFMIQLHRARAQLLDFRFCSDAMETSYIVLL